MKRFLVAMIRFYQRFISPSLKSQCRFEVTCSHYAIHVLEYHGLCKGIWLIAKRLFRCHPYSQERNSLNISHE